ncbi:MAG: tRNA1(Val) (adenine(37)-N6)-methyltransferase [Nitrospirota bacterium]
MFNPMVTHDFLRDVQIYQHKDGYRFSVDALLIYSFVNLSHAKSIADLGAGSGVIGLLLAKKYPESKVALIELQEGLARLAEKNVAVNKLEDRVKVINTDIKELFKWHAATMDLQSKGIREDSKGDAAYDYGSLIGKYDLVVSNPPYRRVTSGKISPGDERAIARHEVKLPLPELAKAASLLLKHNGRFAMVHLPERLIEIIVALQGNGMEPKRLRFVHSKVDAEAKMILIEAVKGARPGLVVEKPLLIYKDDGSYTEEMQELYTVE